MPSGLCWLSHCLECLHLSIFQDLEYICHLLQEYFPDCFILMHLTLRLCIPWHLFEYSAF